MKFNKIILLAALALFPMLFSCNKENMGTVYAPTGSSEMTFLQKKIYNHVLKNDATVFNIPVYRNVDTEAATMPITFTPADGSNDQVVFPASVSFAAGAKETNIPVDISKVPVGDVIKGTVAFGTAKADSTLYNAAAAITSVSIDLAKDYEWVSLGTGEFLDNWWYGEIWDGVEYIKADGFEIYRAMYPYEKGKDENTTAKKPEFIEFTINKATGAVTFKTFATPVEYSGGVIYAYWPSDFSSKYAEYDASSFFMDDFYVLFCPVWYIEPDVGGWGARPNTVILSLPGAPMGIEEKFFAE